MIDIVDLKLMNDVLITYYQEENPKNEKKILKHQIIKQILEIENCFQKISEIEAKNILKDIGVKEEKIDCVYNNILKNIK